MLSSTEGHSTLPGKLMTVYVSCLACAGYKRAKGPSISNWRITQLKKWQCIVCGFIYDEEQGLPEEGIAPGTPWQDIPDDWMCPDCGVGKEDFEMVEI
jgi:rubredoxin